MMILSIFLLLLMTAIPTSNAGQAGVGVRGISLELVGEPYYEGDNIIILVKNGFDHPVWSFDWKTACSIVGLEKLDGSRWIALTGCMLGRPAIPIQLDAKSEHHITIDPRSPHLAKLTTNSSLAFGQGTYRAKIVYQLSLAVVPEKNAVAVYSPGFQIRP